MHCQGCGVDCSHAASTFILEQPRDLRGWRVMLCGSCEVKRDEEQFTDVLVTALRGLAQQASWPKRVERV